MELIGQWSSKITGGKKEKEKNKFQQKHIVSGWTN